MAQFLPLTVTDIHHTIRDAVVLTLQPQDPDAFAFTQGQYLTFKQDFDGTELRRNYSICAGLDDGKLQVGIKRVDGGAFSTFANTELKVGDTLHAMPPSGSFHTPIEPDKAKNYLGFAGGSGVTPVLSILRTVMTREPDSTFTLIYANRAVGTIMFREELEDLKNRYMGRLTLIHVLETGQDIDLFTGRVDQDKCADLFKSWIDIGSIDTAFICGPEPMMLAIADALKSHGLADGQIKFELFSESQKGQLAKQEIKERAKGQAGTKTTVIIDGTGHQFEMPKDQSVLETALANDLDAPFSCKAGVCSTCKAKVTEGEYEMLTNHALEDYEVEAGFVLTCQCYALSDTLVVDYDQH
ncbi:2Fe-2S iron-sulfur cluster binding domain-containing protein [Sulfitobacter pseudonitzschiae]|uniref:2Fe-2S iron-sulfur cluster binding domain-containing protein n=1 Tax=Pseudosulfitobacter pseudonitzschiae TaxID=1402135 RepID=A0A9Q2RS84_9RHOB|nr:2Fe-2S iron-sulfur cluster-binding protein [Pseudosulfitobacter pseudonitzschiae]MBM2290747.1 2Fe-2S iron-sulfur cluster binding domain-containing protein [Pseudosulfitobacter pseudonitzschiae]MBM2295665.1 2Fe-2S iron-sulfur cluster binding domain-containing protein [Pseudosulfitobacter pseudonitzschiae]MBM2300577.1 2Fe-2S iron-sulfur cluster binding domain-containing protein [Pseudosulfitobacter pseudonitzschiae]MBM2310362.1 2Fe-2S iron-sulfur cluster binding domain-containing protein [Pseu